MLFAKSSLGFYPNTWDVADQYWFEELQVKSGVIASHNLALPAQGEKNQQEIEAIAADYISQQTGLDYPLNDPEKYRLYRVFSTVLDEANHETRIWLLEYESLDLSNPDFKLTLSPKGNVLTYSDTLDALSNPVKQATLLYDRYVRLYSDKYGSQDAWSQARWQEMKEKLSVLLQGREAEPLYAIIIAQSYLPMPQNAIAKEKAIIIAAQAVAEQYGVSADRLTDSPLDDTTKPYAIALNGDTDSPVWKVSFGRTYYAEIDAVKGQAGVVNQYQTYEHPIRRYALDETIPEGFGLLPLPVPSGDGKN